MKLSHIRDILAVAETGSLRAASRKLGITQPTMTRSIRDTENELGTWLFTRHAHGVMLTEAGRLFVRRATAIQSEIRHMLEEQEQAKGRFKGQVSVAMSSAASIALMPAILDKFQSKHPEALVKLTESLLQPIEADIISGEIDFFVGPFYDGTSTTSLVVERLFDNRRVVVVRRGHPLAGAKTLDDLVDVRWIRPTFSDRRDEADFETMFERAGLPLPDIAVQTRSMMMTLLAVTNSDLVTILPLQWFDLSLTGDSVETIELPDSLSAAPVCVVRRGDLPLTPLAERLYDMVVKAGLNYSEKMSQRLKQERV